MAKTMRRDDVDRQAPTTDALAILQRYFIENPAPKEVLHALRDYNQQMNDLLEAEDKQHKQLKDARTQLADAMATLRPFARWWADEVNTPRNRYMSPGGAYPTHDEIEQVAAIVAKYDAEMNDGTQR